VSAGRNLIAGLGGSAWTAIVNLGAVPFYLHYLGIESYALVGFYITLQALFVIVDMGLTPTVSREVAGCLAVGRVDESRSLLKTFEIFYWSVAVIIAVVAFTAAPPFISWWLSSAEIQPDVLKQAATIMVLIIALRCPLGLYQGALTGAERFGLASIINAAFATLTALLTISVLTYVSESITAFFSAQVFVAALYLMTLRLCAKRVIGQHEKRRANFDLSILMRASRFAAGMSAITATSVVFTQMDKLTVSRMLGLESFGYYALAVAVSGALYVLVTPVFNMVYPRMSALFAAKQFHDLEQYYAIATRFMASVILPVGITLAFYSTEVLMIWTGDPVVANNAGPIVRLLALGSTLHAIMYIPYSAQLAFGNTLIPLLTNLLLMSFSIPFLVLLVNEFGAIGAGCAWLGLQTAYLLLGSVVTHRYLLQLSWRDWFGKNVLIQMMVTGISVLVVGGFLQEYIDSNWLRVFSGSLFGAILIVFNVLLFKNTRQIIIGILRRNSTFIHQ